jgi:hypothetical protein
MYSGADKQPGFLQEFDLAHVRISRDWCQEDDIAMREVLELQAWKVAPYDRDDTLLAAV